MQIDSIGRGGDWRNMVCILVLACVCVCCDIFPSLWVWNAEQEVRGHWPTPPMGSHVQVVVGWAQARHIALVYVRNEQRPC